VSRIDWDALGVRCPRCLEPLKPAGSDSLDCAKCRKQYPVHFGIPDLRTGDDPYLSRAEDLAAATRLAAKAPTCDFAELLQSYYATNDRVAREQVAQFTRGTLAAAGRAQQALDAWERHDRRVAAPRVAGATMLDVGCGTGPLAIAAARRGWQAVGVDVGLRWLVLAQQRCREAGVQVPFVCANVEILPFLDGCVARAGGESIIENATDPAQALLELSRVLQHGGRLWLTTPNKRSLGPDPHLGVPAGGWWPERMLKRHAERAGKVYPRRQLFTHAALREALEHADFEDIRIELPDIAETQAATQSPLVRQAIGAYRVARRVPVARSLLRAVAPTYLVSATRS
jgi:SAM-dependent methyltransferase